MSKKKNYSAKRKKLKRGMVVIWDHKNFNPKFWKNLSKEDRIKYYGPLGYKSKKPKLFVFLSRIFDHKGMDTGHCVLVSLDDQKIETMRHTDEFRPATDEEF